jgi:hypothetical protein
MAAAAMQAFLQVPTPPATLQGKYTSKYISYLLGKLMD